MSRAGVNNHPHAPSVLGVRSALLRGDSAQDILDTLVAAIIEDDSYDPDVACTSIVMLADHGARVATDQPGCALDDLICKPRRSRPGLFLDVARRLAGKPGELPFHVLARHGHLQLSPDMLEDPAVRASLRARDSGGRTISHWLWDENNPMTVAASIIPQRSGGDADRAQGWWMACVKAAWSLQDKLQELGVGMDLPDNHGTTALELCADRISQKSAFLISGMKACSMFEAYQASLTMEDETRMPSPLSPPSSGPRF